MSADRTQDHMEKTYHPENYEDPPEPEEMIIPCVTCGEPFDAADLGIMCMGQCARCWLRRMEATLREES